MFSHPKSTDQDATDSPVQNAGDVAAVAELTEKEVLKIAEESLDKLEELAESYRQRNAELPINMGKYHSQIFRIIYKDPYNIFRLLKLFPTQEGHIIYCYLRSEDAFRRFVGDNKGFLKKFLAICPQYKTKFYKEPILSYLKSEDCGLFSLTLNLPVLIELVENYPEKQDMLLSFVIETVKKNVNKFLSQKSKSAPLSIVMTLAELNCHKLMEFFSKFKNNQAQIEALKGEIYASLLKAVKENSKNSNHQGKNPLLEEIKFEIYRQLEFRRVLQEDKQRRIDNVRDAIISFFGNKDAAKKALEEIDLECCVGDFEYNMDYLNDAILATFPSTRSKGVSRHSEAFAIYASGIDRHFKEEDGDLDRIKKNEFKNLKLKGCFKEFGDDVVIAVLENIIIFYPERKSHIFEFMITLIKEMHEEQLSSREFFSPETLERFFNLFLNEKESIYPICVDNLEFLISYKMLDFMKGFFSSHSQSLDDMATQLENSSDMQKRDWYRKDGVEINRSLYKSGITILRLAATTTGHAQSLASTNAGPDTFSLGANRYQRLKRHKIESKAFKSEITKSEALLNELDPSFKLSEKSAVLRKWVLSRNGEYTPFSDEAFVPFVFQSQQSTCGLYVFPWLSSEQKGTSLWPSETLNEAEAKGFEYFVTAICLMGSNLQGVDQNGVPMPIVRHNRTLFRNQIIQDIPNCHDTDHPYDLLALELIKKKIDIAKKLCNQTKMPVFSIHIPWLDYIFFGFELFLRGQMTVNALKIYTQIVLDKRKQIYQDLEHLFSDTKITLEVGSPLSNILLFKDGIDTAEDLRSGSELVDKLFVLFDINVANINLANQIESDAAHAEHEVASNKLICDFINKAINLLLANNTNLPQQNAWQEMKEKGVFEQGCQMNMDQFLNVANTSVLLSASLRCKALKACSLLPLSEKEIQLHYRGRKNNIWYRALPPMVMITYIDPVNVAGYQSDLTKNDRSAFYAPRECQYALSKGVRESGLLESCMRNVFLFSNNGKPKSIKKVMGSNSLIRIGNHQ